MEIRHKIFWNVTPFSVVRNFSIYLVNIKFTLEQATKAQRGSRGIDLLFL
jgi:hypothetical protein